MYELHYAVQNRHRIDRYSTRHTNVMTEVILPSPSYSLSESSSDRVSRQPSRDYRTANLSVTFSLYGI